MKQKKIALLLSGAMLMGMMAGCSAKGTPAATADTAAGSAAPSASFNETGYPIVNEPITMKIMMSIRDVDTLGDPSEMPAVKRLEEQTGINLEWEVIKASDWTTKLNLMFASGEYPDIILSPNAPVDDEEYGVTQQLLIPIDDELTTKYMPTYTERTKAEETDPTTSLLASDGHKYSIGYLVGQNINTNAHYFINKTWLDSLGLAMPTTLDELTEVLRAFKTQDPNGNGQSDEVPYQVDIDSGFPSIRYALPLFGIPCDASRWIYIDDNKKVQFAPTQTGFRECMEWLNTLYSEGLVDPEIISQDSATAENKIEKEGKSGFFTMWRLQAMGFAEEVLPQYTMMMPVADEGTKPSLYRYLEMAKPGAFVTAANQHVPETLRLLDAMLDTETMYSLYYGEKDATDGTGWAYNENGKIDSLYNGDTQVKNFLDCNALFFAPANYLEKTFNMPLQRTEKTEYCKKYEEAGDIQKYSDDYLNLAPLTSEQIQASALKETDIKNAVLENMATFITTGVTDDSWNAFVKLFDNMNVNEYVQMYQSAIDTMNILEAGQ